MKKNNLVRYLMILSFGIILVACSKNDEIPNTHIIGAYTGTLTKNLEIYKAIKLIQNRLLR